MGMITNWVCDHCYGLMNMKKEARNLFLIECPNCGTYWYVDQNDEILNNMPTWSPTDDEDGEYEEEYDD